MDTGERSERNVGTGERSERIIGAGERAEQVFTLPDFGEGLVEGVVRAWRVAVGDTVVIGQKVVVVQMPRATVEVQIPFAGTVIELHVPENSALAVGAPLITVGVESAANGLIGRPFDAHVPGERYEQYREEERAGSGHVLIGYGTSAGTRRRRRRVGGMAGTRGSGGVGSDDGVPQVISPAVRKSARDRGVDLRTVSGSGVGGVITEADVAAASAGAGIGIAEGAGSPGAAAVDSNGGAAGSARGVGLDSNGAEGAAPGSGRAVADSRGTASDSRGAASDSNDALAGASATAADRGGAVVGSGDAAVDSPSAVSDSKRGASDSVPATAALNGHAGDSAGAVANSAGAVAGSGGADGRASGAGGRSRVAAAFGFVAQRIPLAGVRKVIADRLSTSRREIPDATTWLDVDATELLRARRVINAALPRGERIGLPALPARLAIAALRQYPELNAVVDIERGEIVRFDRVNLGIVARTPHGRVVPVLERADAMTTVELSTQLRDVLALADSGTIPADRLTGGTFTIDNYGASGMDGSTATAANPDAPLLGIGRIVDRPWAVGGEMTLRKITRLSLTFDQRVCDADSAEGFLRLLADYIESPIAALGRI
ncbi:2-oxo acid dehydrogenase subunit E2 [Nocardia panacis]|uniref:Dihydrolipoamide acetyltransferase component of pyruvate dehydrogenase complex n=2 Tax=Nocardia panacis TaxID=2340916 RepID=A0A3A4K8K4_9NOCA|nr:2-oxo acid dehydrogenase subunit E2 [Nocardia panacis]